MSTDLRTTPRTDSTVAHRDAGGGRTLSIIGLVCAAIAVFALPIVFGPAAIILGIVAYRKGDRLGMWAVVAGVVGMLAGFALGYAVFNAKQDAGA